MRAYNLHKAIKVQQLYDSITNMLKQKNICGRKLVYKRREIFNKALCDRLYTVGEYKEWFKSQQIT